MAPPDLPLFERDREQAVLSAVIGELRSGRPALVTVTGEPGLGQNELLRWAAGQARDRGVHVLAARATSAEHELRYGVVAQLLAPEDRDIATRLFVAPQRPGGLPGLNHLLTACHDRPTLLVVQDVQWLDPASLRWLEALARRLPRAPLALLTSTTGTAIDRPEWSVGTPLTGLASTIELALPPLTTSGVSAAVRTVCGVPGDTDFTHALAQATRGVPAVVHEVLLRFTRTGCAPRAEHVEHLRALTAEVVGDHAAQALSELRDPVAVDVLRALAVCGDLLDFPLVCTLAGLHPVPEARLRATLMASGLLTPATDRPPATTPWCAPGSWRRCPQPTAPTCTRAPPGSPSGSPWPTRASPNCCCAPAPWERRGPWPLCAGASPPHCAAEGGTGPPPTSPAPWTSRCGPRNGPASNSSWPRCRWSPPPRPRSAACTASYVPPAPVRACVPRPSTCASSAATPAPRALLSPPAPEHSATLPPTTRTSRAAAGERHGQPARPPRPGRRGRRDRSPWRKHVRPGAPGRGRRTPRAHRHR